MQVQICYFSENISMTSALRLWNFAVYNYFIEHMHIFASLAGILLQSNHRKVFYKKDVFNVQYSQGNTSGGV